MESKMTQEEKYMREAIRQARKAEALREVPIGCIIVFEMFIALLQAFIYTVLSCIYLGDALHEH